ncbi:3-oxoadipate enol-lactonase [Salinifilum aidingensis]
MTVHYELAGPEDAPVVVLSNSIGMDLRLWDEQVPALAERFRVVRYDQRGHGRTPASTPGPYSLADLGGDVLSLLDELGVHRAHFAGVSLGGMTGMWLAESAPERIDRLALLCTAAGMPPQSWHDRAALVREKTTEALVEPSLPKWFTPTAAADPQVRERFAEQLRGADDEGYAGCCEAIATMDIREHLGAITAPTLVIAGAEDPATPPARSAEIAAAIGGSRLEVIDSGAHLANAEQPAAVNRLLLEHFSAQP